MEGLGVAANVIAVVDISSKVIGICIQYARDVRDAKSEQLRLSQTVTTLYHTSKGAQNLLEGPYGSDLKKSQALLSAMQDSKHEITCLEALLSTGKSTKLGAFRWPFRSKEVDTRIKSLERCSNAIDSALQVHQTAITIDHEIQAALNQLPIAQGAVFDSHADEHNPTCLEGTRVETLDEISRWMNDPKGKPIFWLNGMAGTGKSTISRTLAKRRHENGELVATFFFKNGEADRVNLNKLISTIARQLADKVPGTRSFIRDAINADATLVDSGLREQLEKLILKPLSKSTAVKVDTSSFVIVIDALDECHRDADIELLINVLCTVARYPAINLRVFVTSRPELPIRLGFNSIRGTYQDLVLHEIAAPKVEHDIAHFLRYELEKTRLKFNKAVRQERNLSSNWLTEEDLQRLVRMAVPLFIVAATISRFVADRRGGNPGRRLASFLCQAEETHGSRFDMIYGPVLDQQLDGLSNTDRKQILVDFHLVVGAIVTLEDPLPAGALARLLDVPQNIVDDRLDFLHSVLNVPEDPQMPVRLLHLSFRDYLVHPDSKNANEFWINQSLVHSNMASQCLRIMQTHLRKDICDLRGPGMLQSEVDPQRVKRFLPPELQYACLYWVEHCVKGVARTEIITKIHNFLKKHFLHWLEVLSIISGLYSAEAMLRKLQNWLDNWSQIGPRPFPSDKVNLGFTQSMQWPSISDLRSFLRDAYRFAKSLSICKAPLQIYSALAVEPINSRLRRALSAEIPDWLSVRPVKALGTREPPYLNDICAVEFSPDFKKIASSSEDGTVGIWSIETQECIETLQGREWSNWLVRNPIVFSPNSNSLAFALDPNRMGVWDLEAEKWKQIIDVTNLQLRSIAFSPDSEMVAIGFKTGSSRIWNIETGECQRVLNGGGNILSVGFSPNMKMLVSSSSNETEIGRIWNLETGICEKVLKDDISRLVPTIYAVTFLRNSKTVATASRQTLRLWNVETGECTRLIETKQQIYTLHSRADDTVLHTNFGEVSLSDAPTSSLSSSAVPEAEWRLGVFEEQDGWWVTCNNVRLFRVSMYQGTTIATAGLDVVVGDEFSQIWLLRFSVGLLKKLTSGI